MQKNELLPISSNRFFLFLYEYKSLKKHVEKNFAVFNYFYYIHIYLFSGKTKY